MEQWLSKWGFWYFFISNQTGWNNENCTLHLFKWRQRRKNTFPTAKNLDLFLIVCKRKATKGFESSVIKKGRKSDGCVYLGSVSQYGSLQTGEEKQICVSESEGKVTEVIKVGSVGEGLTAGPWWGGWWGCRTAGAERPSPRCGCWTWAAWTEVERRRGSPTWSSARRCCREWCGGGTAGSCTGQRVTHWEVGFLKASREVI